PFTAGSVPFGVPVFIPQGNHMHFGQTGDLSCVGPTIISPTTPKDCDNPVVGAVSAVVADPSDANTLWIGSVNGGVWRTVKAATPGPTVGIGNVPWQPLLDLGPDMSISALALDPTVQLTGTSITNAVLVAGLGNASSAFKSSALAGIIRSADGGDSWTSLGTTDLSGLTVTGVAPRGSVIVVSTKGANGGLWRSTNTGQTFIKISGNIRLFGLP